MGLLAATYAVLAVLAITERIDLWHVLAGAFVAGMVWVTDFPARRSMIAEVVQPHHVGTAMGLEMATSNFSRMLGPLAAGGFLATVGIQGRVHRRRGAVRGRIPDGGDAQLPGAGQGRAARCAAVDKLRRRDPLHPLRRRGSDDAGDNCLR